MVTTEYFSTKRFHGIIGMQSRKDLVARSFAAAAVPVNKEPVELQDQMVSLTLVPMQRQVVITGTSLLHARWPSRILIEPLTRQVATSRKVEKYVDLGARYGPLHLWTNRGRDLGHIQHITSPRPWWPWKEDFSELGWGYRDKLPLPNDLNAILLHDSLLAVDCTD